MADTFMPYQESKTIGAFWSVCINVGSSLGMTKRRKERKPRKGRGPNVNEYRTIDMKGSRKNREERKNGKGEIGK